jgi:histidinol-phosphate phosphatase family protein
MVHKVHDILRVELARHGAKFDAIYYCPHVPDAGCDCRKPLPGMLHRAQKDLDIDLAHSYVIGDKQVDVETAHAVGAKSILVLTGYGREERESHKADSFQPHFVAENLTKAVDAILAGDVG